MPAFEAFGRKWKIGSDDFIYTAMIDCNVKTFWLISTIIVYTCNVPQFESCQNDFHIKAYFLALTISITLGFIIDVGVIKNSSKGAIMDIHARRFVKPLVYLRLFWETIDVGFNILGTLWIFGDTFNCLQETSPYAYSFIRRFVICNWVSIGIIILLLRAFYDPHGKCNTNKSYDVKQCTNIYDVPITHSSVRWEKQFRFLFCFWKKYSSSSSEDDLTVIDGFHEVGRLIGHLFHESSDFVASDIVAGLIALWSKEKKMRRLESKALIVANHDANVFLKNVITKPPISVLKSSSNDDDCKKTANPEADVYNLRHFLNFIHGISGWKGFILHRFKDNPIGQLWENAILCGCLRKPYQNRINIIDDNCCFCHTSALKKSLPTLKEEDIIYVSFKVDYYEVPFYIALDHSTKSIVITLRGSYSMKDAIADLTAVPTEFKVVENDESSPKFLAHHGMLLVAQKLKKKLDDLNILVNLKEKYPEYKFVLVGQSLGGGCAAILGILLHPQYNDLKVYCFNAPGCVLSAEGAEWCESFITSVTYGDDMFARISIASLDEFKNRIRDTIEDCATPKYKIFTKGFISCLCCHKSTLSFYSDEKSNNKNDKQDINIQVELNSHNNMNGNKSGKQQEVSYKYANFKYNQTMCLPGRILHITEIPRWNDDVSQNNGFRFQMRWAHRDEFNKIIISPRMDIDHLYFRMVKAFEEYL